MAAHRKPNALLVNDENFILFTYLNVLNSYFNVFVAENGMQATQYVCSRHYNFFSAIFLDICMPIMDGIQAYHAIKEFYDAQLDDSQFEQPPIYILSTDDSAEIEERLRDCDFKNLFNTLREDFEI